MPSYSEIAAEMVSQEQGTSLVLWLRSKLAAELERMAAKTERTVVLYEANHRGPRTAQAAGMSEKDLEFFMDVLKGVPAGGVDIILNSWGGSPDAADMLGAYLRQKFTSIRIFVPVEAMSAATMLACGSNSIVMGKHSFLGPIDLQMPFKTTDGHQYCAAQDVLDQYELMRDDLKQDVAAFWTGPGARYWPDTVIRCKNALSYGCEVAQRGLEEVMFRDLPNAKQLAHDVAADLGNHQKHRAHARRLSRTYLKSLGMIVTDLEEDHELQDIVLTIHHLSSHFFESLPPVAKLVQSSFGRFAFDLEDNSTQPAGMDHKVIRILREVFQTADGLGNETGPDEPPARKGRKRAGKRAGK